MSFESINYNIVIGKNILISLTQVPEMQATNVLNENEMNFCDVLLYLLIVKAMPTVKRMKVCAI